jgi:hypothetical protein
MGVSRDRVRSALVVVEVALALVLLVGSGLLIRTALALDAVDPGFDAQGVLSARVALPPDQYLDDVRIVQTLEHLVEQTRAVPGVTRAAVVSQVPLGPGGNSNGLIPEGRPLDPRHQHAVAPGQRRLRARSGAGQLVAGAPSGGNRSHPCIEPRLVPRLGSADELQKALDLSSSASICVHLWIKNLRPSADRCSSADQRRQRIA